MVDGGPELDRLGAAGSGGNEYQRIGAVGLPFPKTAKSHSLSALHQIDHTGSRIVGRGVYFDVVNHAPPLLTSNLLTLQPFLIDDFRFSILDANKNPSSL